MIKKLTIKLVNCEGDIVTCILFIDMSTLIFRNESMTPVRPFNSRLLTIYLKCETRLQVC